jgi:hypothetical protein
MILGLERGGLLRWRVVEVKSKGTAAVRVAFLEPGAVVFLVQSATLPRLSEYALRGSARRCSSHIRTAAIL